MKAVPLVKAIALAALFTLYAGIVLAQTDRQLAEANQLTESDWTDTLDYGEWLLNAQYWFDHSDSPYAKEFFAGLNLSAEDDAQFRTIVRDFNQRHHQLMAGSYAILDTPDWTPEAQTKLTKDLVDATHDATQRINSNLTAGGAKSVAAAALGPDPL